MVDSTVEQTEPAAGDESAVNKKSRWDFLKRFRRKSTQVSEPEKQGELTNKEIWRQGPALIEEASTILYKVPVFNEAMDKVYREAASYRSLERPIQIKADFNAGGYDYIVRLSETQNTDPRNLLIIVKDPNDKTNAPERLNVDLRARGKILADEPRISYTSGKVGESQAGQPSVAPDTHEAVRRIRQTLNDLKSRIGTPAATPQR